MPMQCNGTFKTMANYLWTRTFVISIVLSDYRVETDLSISIHCCPKNIKERLAWYGKIISLLYLLPTFPTHLALLIIFSANFSPVENSRHSLTTEKFPSPIIAPISYLAVKDFGHTPNDSFVFSS